MQAIPAIDILNGSCVRLAAGEYDAVTVYDENPLAVAQRFFAAGFKRLHIVDLDAAKTGQPTNHPIIKRILSLAAQHDVAVDIGGGIRSPDTIEAMLAAGAKYVVLGTVAVKDPLFRQQMIEQFPDKIIVGVDCRDNIVATDGWQQTGGLTDTDFINSVNQCPPALIIYTDISKDGMLSGVNVEQTATIARLAKCPVIASGGIASLADFTALSQHSNIQGAIIGKAIYNGNVDLTTLSELYP